MILFSSWKFLLFVVLVLPLSFITQDFAVSAQEDEIVDEEPATTEEEASDEDAVVENEEETPKSGTAATSQGEEEEEEEKVEGITASPDVETVVLFPDHADKQLPAGKLIHTLVGFSNRGEKDFVVDVIDASFRYPQDFSYHIQNFSSIGYKSVVPAGQEATFKYSFFPHESYGGRPFGLVMVMSYHDLDGNQFASSVVNETITFHELDNFNGEQFFMYIFLAGLAVLVIFALNYAFSSFKKNKGSSGQHKSEAFEQGTQNGGVDMDWIPSSSKKAYEASSSPRRTPRTRNRKAAAAAAESANE